MCCRYWVDESPELLAMVEKMKQSPLAERWAEASGRIVERGEVRPSDVAPAVASNREGARAVFPMKWGFAGSTLLMNARVETASVRPTFREAWAAHRCAVPASGYFEWEHLPTAGEKARAGDRFRIRPKGEGVTWLCGLYRIERGLPVFVILTREPGEGIRFLHDRMPLILPGDRVDEWIRPDADPAALLDAALTDMEFQREEPRSGEAVQLSML